MKKRLFSLLLALVITSANMETALAAVEAKSERDLSVLEEVEIVSEDNDKCEEQPETANAVEFIDVKEENGPERSSGSEEEQFVTG